MKLGFLQGISTGLVVGNPEDQGTDIGPMISQKEAERAEAWIQEAISQGARASFGGKRVSLLRICSLR